MNEISTIEVDEDGKYVVKFTRILDKSIDHSKKINRKRVELCDNLSDAIAVSRNKKK